MKKVAVLKNGIVENTIVVADDFELSENHVLIQPHDNVSKGCEHDGHCFIKRESEEELNKAKIADLYSEITHDRLIEAIISTSGKDWLAAKYSEIKALK